MPFFPPARSLCRTRGKRTRPRSEKARGARRERDAFYALLDILMPVARSKHNHRAEGCARVGDRYQVTGKGFLFFYLPWTLYPGPFFCSRVDLDVRQGLPEARPEVFLVVDVLPGRGRLVH